MAAGFDSLFGLFFLLKTSSSYCSIFMSNAFLRRSISFAITSLMSELASWILPTLRQSTSGIYWSKVLILDAFDLSEMSG